MTRTVGNYRPEIDGLRAIAVLSVIAFHAKLAPITGGYVGVDIFFVISGYLITRNIIDDLTSGSFSFSHFYSRRIRRLFPALLFTVAAVFLAAALWFPPVLLRGEAREVIVALASLSNIHFWRESHGYFSPVAMSAPLLHTWSLSVEEQYYVVWSGILVTAGLLRRPLIIPFLILATGFASLVGCQVWLSRDPAAAFYLTPFRMFEFSIGALCIWAERLWPPNVMVADLFFAAGLAGIGYAICIFGPATPFPGIHALVPIIAAAAIIYAGRQTRLANILNNRVAVNIGLISYSLYLCHWPILVFSTYIFGEPERLSTRLILCATCLVVAALMYFFVEKPFRVPSHSISTRAFVQLLGRCVVITAPLIVLALLALPNPQGAWFWRLNKEKLKTERLESFGQRPCLPVYGKCIFGDLNGPLGVEIMGDSYAQHLVAAFQPFLLANGMRGEIRASGGCLIISGALFHGTGDCENERRGALADFGNSTVPLVISQAWISYLSGILNNAAGLDPSDKQRLLAAKLAIERTVERFGKSGRPILIVGAQIVHNCLIDQFRLQPGPLPHWRQNPCPDFPLEKLPAINNSFDEILREIQSAHPNTVSLLIPVDYLCDRTCPLSKNGLWYYQDASHFTVAGAEYLGFRAHDKIAAFLKHKPVGSMRP